MQSSIREGEDDRPRQRRRRVRPHRPPLRVSRLEENVGADAVTLTPDQLRRLDELPAPEGEHHTAEQMRLIER